MNNLRSVVIGLDGGTFDVFKPLVDSGVMGNLSKFLNKGVVAPLLVELPCATLPNWVSFMTGKNVGNHGIYDFFRRDDCGYGLKFVHPSILGQETLWDHLSKIGRKVGVMNVPATYPPRPLNGFLLTGLLTPKGRMYTYPAELQGKIKKKFPEYKIEFDVPITGDTRKLVSSLAKSMRNRIEVAKYLVGEHRPDFFMIVLRETDRFQHEQFHLIKDTIDNKKFHRDNPVVVFYSTLDELIGEFVKGISDDSHIFLMSDHGFASFEKIVNITNYLLAEGLMRLKSSFKSKVKYKAFQAGWNPKTALKIFNRFGVKRKVKEFRNQRREQAFSLQGKLFFSYNDIDWEETIAYCPTQSGALINVNVKGREPLGCIDKEDYYSVRQDLIQKLMRLRDPDDGRTIIERVIPREELYHGKYLQQLPDLFLLPAQEYDFFAPQSFPFAELTSETVGRTGKHTPNGMFACFGPDVKKGKQLETVDIKDIAPTILHTMRENIPDFMDGEVINGLFLKDAGSLPKKVTRRDKNSDCGFAQLEEYSDEEAKVLAERLKALGYL